MVWIHWSCKYWIQRSKAEVDTVYYGCKSIIKVEQGPWLVKKVVGQMPVLIGNKLKQRYYFSDNYLEICTDVTSDSFAKMVYLLINIGLQSSNRFCKKTENWNCVDTRGIIQIF